MGWRSLKVFRCFLVELQWGCVGTDWLTKYGFSQPLRGEQRGEEEVLG